MSSATILLSEADQWRLRYGDCRWSPPDIESLQLARFILSLHSGHGPDCLPFAAALRRASEPVE